MLRLPIQLSANAPTVSQRRLALVIIGVLAAGCLLALPMVDLQLSPLPGFIVISDTILFVVCLTTAALLYTHAALARSISLIVLAMGYLMCALLIAAHLLTYPGALSDTGFLHANVQSAVWLYVFFSLALPPAAATYAFMKNRAADGIPAKRSTTAAILISIMATVSLAVVCIRLSTVGEMLLPRIMESLTQATQSPANAVAAVVIASSVAAIGLLWRYRRSTLDLWLIVALSAAFIEAVFMSLAHSRYSLMWYAGRIYVMVSTSFVLVMLLAESARLYSRLAVSLAAHYREREHKRMSLEALIDAIAHRLNQPLCAIVANGDAAISLLENEPANIVEARAALKDIAADGQRASEMISTMRAVLSGSPGASDALRVDALLQEALLVLRMDLNSHEVILEVQAAPNLPPVRGNRSQLVQLLVNMLTNAVESMTHVPEGPRRLRVSSTALAPASIAITIEDSGIGIAPEYAARIFNPFFTTKPHRAGLGLALCRMIAETHGGEIVVNPGALGGSAFQVILPTAQVA